MRSFRCKAWDWDEKKWHEDVAIIGGVPAVIEDAPEDSIVISVEMKDKTINAYSDWAKYVMKPGWSLVQYTGLKDKNGIEIYEGDLIRVRANNSGLLQVEFVNAYVGGWVLTHHLVDEYVSLGARNQSEIEIVGNIYENPDLSEKPQC